MYDWVIRNARVVDGLKGEVRADVCLKGDRIAELLPPGAEAETANVVEASGYLLTPGFIDIHRHADLMPLSGQPWTELVQGITTMVSGNCGFSAVPNSAETFEAARQYAAPILGLIPPEIRGMGTKAFYETISRRPMKVNCGYLVGNGALRRSVAGFSEAPLSLRQLQEICGLLEEALTGGAMGLSMGIMYTPECYYSTEELIAIARVAARHGKPVISHIRGEGRSVVASVDEMIEIGRASGARIHISHMKAAGMDMWGHAVDTLLEHIHQGRRAGLEISFDAYPYTAGSTTLLSLFPPEVLAGGTQGVLDRIADSRDRAGILDELGRTREGWDNFIQLLGWERVIVSGSSNPKEVGRSIQELAREAGSEPGDYALDLLLREKGCVPIVLYQTAQEDVDRIIEEEACIVISDSLYSAAGMPHPRKYGAFQRFLCRYVKEKGSLSLPRAIDKISRMPAEFLRIRERGRVEKGFFADLLLIDWGRLQDRATYADPIKDSEGICKVFVNGKLAFSDGKATGKAAGILLNRA